jgi:hypothetical protein
VARWYISTKVQVVNPRSNIDIHEDDSNSIFGNIFMVWQRKGREF